MTPPDELTNRILRLINNWDLIEAREECIKVEAELSDMSRETLVALLSLHEELDDKLKTAVDLIESQPQEALDRLRNLPVTAQSHPEYAGAVQRAKKATDEAKRQEALRLCTEAKSLAGNARLWPDAETKIKELQNIFPSWAEDPGLQPIVSTVREQIEAGKVADAKLNALDRTLEDGDWTSAQELLNDLETSDYISAEELGPRRETLEKLYTRAMGRSTRQEFDTEVQNLRASLVSLEGAQNWRAAYNNLHRLVNLLRQEGREDEAAQESQRAESYLQALRDIVYKTINDRLADARVALGKGYLAKARGLVLAAARTGVPPEPRPGEPVDVAGEILPSPEQDKDMADLLNEIEERENARAKAEEFVEKALSSLGQRTLAGLYDARRNLQLVRGLDPRFPGLDALEKDVSAKIHATVQAQVKALGSHLTRVAERGDIEAAQKVLAGLRSLGPEAGDLVEYERTIKRAEQRRQRVEQQRSAFHALFEHTQDVLDCAQAQKLSAALQAWGQVAFDSSGPASAQARLERFLAECEAWAASRQALLIALQSRTGLEAQVKAADCLAESSVGNRPAIADLLARFWQAMAEEHGAHGADVEYLRRAQRFAKRAGNELLQSQLATEIEHALSRTQEGRRIASIEQRLRDYLEGGDLQAGLELIKTLPADDPARSDPAVSMLISETGGIAARKQAVDLINMARQDYQQGELTSALHALNKSLQKITTLEAQKLQMEISQKLAWEKGKSAILDEALKVDVTDPDRTLAGIERQALAECKAVADEVVRHKPSPKLARKASQVAAAYDQWRANIEARVNQLKEEIADRVDHLEFDEAEHSIQQVERLGVPENLVTELVELRRKVHGARRRSERVEDRIQQAKKQAALGEFNKAIRMLNLTASEIPGELRSQCTEWQAHWSENLQVYTKLQNDLPTLRKDFQEHLSPSVDSPKNPLDEVLQRIADGIQNAKAIKLSEDEQYRQSYEFLQENGDWLQDILQTTNDSSIQSTDLENRRGCLEELSKQGVKFRKQLPRGLTALGVSLGQREAWLRERQRVLDRLLETKQAISVARPFRNPFRSPFLNEREGLEQSLNLIDAERQARSKLVDALNKIERQQTYSTLLLCLVPILFVGLLAFFAPLIKNEITSTPASAAIVVTATPKPTGTPTLTPIVVTATPGPTDTPTLTSTPTPTPEVVQKCISNGMRYVLSEPGHSQDEKEYRAGHVENRETVGLLRDVPEQVEFQREWVKILIQRGDAETRGWIRRDWIDCP